MSVIPALLGHESQRQVNGSSSLAYSEVNGIQLQLKQVGRWPTYALSCTCFCMCVSVCVLAVTYMNVHTHMHTIERKMELWMVGKRAELDILF